MDLVVAVSRQLGADGEAVARRVADELNFQYLDREIVSRAAMLAGVSEEALEEAEKVPSLLARIADVLGRYPADELFAVPVGTLPPAPALTHDAYRALIEQVIRSVAERGRAVIVGHAAPVLLKDYPNALTVFVAAPFEYRVRQVAAQERLDLKAAEKRVKEVDRERADFFKTYYGVDWRSPELYHLTVNTARFGVEGAARLIVAAARLIAERLGSPT